MDWGNCVKTVNGSRVATLDCIPVLFQKVIYGLLLFVGIAAAAFIIFAGYKFLTSGGDAKKIGEARKVITFAIAGLLVVLFSFLILNIIAFVTKASCITTFGFSNCQ